MNVVWNECGLKWMWSQMNVVSNECGLKWLWSQMNVVSNECGLKWLWSQMNVVSNECGLKWTWSQMKWSQMNRSQMKVVSNVVVSIEVVSNELSQMNGLKWIGLNSQGTSLNTTNRLLHPNRFERSLLKSFPIVKIPVNTLSHRLIHPLLIPRAGKMFLLDRTAFEKMHPKKTPLFTSNTAVIVFYITYCSSIGL